MDNRLLLLEETIRAQFARGEDSYRVFQAALNCCWPKLALDAAGQRAALGDFAHRHGWKVQLDEAFATFYPCLAVPQRRRAVRS